MQDQINSDKKRKRTLFMLCASMICVAFGVLTILNYLERDISEILLNLLVITVMLAGLIAIRKWNRDLILYRIMHFVIILFYFYGVAHGTGRETVLFWVLIMPLMFFYFFGKKEGLIWTIIFSACIFGIVFATSLMGPHTYSPVLIQRFAVIFLIIIAIGYGLESSRDYYSRLLHEKNEALQQEKERLEKALGEIKTLSGLIPICCHCKKIRNDDGYWQQVEIYVREKTNADFTHGICPECFEKLYPDIRPENRPGTSQDKDTGRQPADESRKKPS